MMHIGEGMKMKVGEKASPAVALGPGKLGMRVSSGSSGRRDEDGRFGGFSNESEDLAAMVGDFWENGSSGAESRYSSDSESGFPELHHLAEKVSFCKHALEHNESSLSLAVHSLISSMNDTDLHPAKNELCNSTCIRQSLVKLLRLSGHDAAVCSSRWQVFDKVPGGDHEYIDVLIQGGGGMSERLIIDLDFRSHFEIARAVESYDAILASLPLAYVGTLSRLTQLLHIMVEAAKCSLKQNSMPLPPWRSLSYLQAKWYSPYERKVVADNPKKGSITCSDHEQCLRHLRKLKASLWSDGDTDQSLKLINTDKNRRAKFERRRPSLLRS